MKRCTRTSKTNGLSCKKDPALAGPSCEGCQYYREQRIAIAMHEDLSGRKCDFICNKDEPLISFLNADTGHEWVCHLSCLQENMIQIMYLKAVNNEENQIHP